MDINNLLSHVYFETGLGDMAQLRASHNGLDRVVIENPYALAGTGLEFVQGRVSFDVGFRHTSSIATGHDHGDNLWHVTVRVKPWGNP